MENNINKNKRDLKLSILFFGLFILFISFWFWGGPVVCSDFSHNFICGSFVFMPMLLLVTILSVSFAVIGFNFLHKYKKDNK